MDKHGLSERDISTKFITPALRKAGWDEMLQIRATSRRFGRDEFVLSRLLWSIPTGSSVGRPNRFFGRYWPRQHLRILGDLPYATVSDRFRKSGRVVAHPKIIPDLLPIIFSMR